MKVAIYGGSFDPVHFEHRNIIDACYKELGVDKVVLLPTYLPPHKKKSETAFEDRVKMLELMFRNVSYVDIDKYELTTGKEVNYAYDMLKDLRKKYPDFVYVIGGDSLLNLDSWYKYEDLLRENELAVIKRENVDIDYENLIKKYTDKYNARITLLDYTGSKLSSTYIRFLCYLERDITEYVGKNVADYIEKKQLYTLFKPIVTKVKNSVSPKLFTHIANTVLCGVVINQICNLKISTTRVFASCLLHDIAKERTNLIYGVPPQTVSTPVFHQFYGEQVAYHEFKIKDEEVLDAIRFHTTAKPEMTNLGKLVYLADKICEGRDYDGVDEIRQALNEGLDKAFLMCLNRSYEYVEQKGENVYPLTKEAVIYYNKENV